MMDTRYLNFNETRMQIFGDLVKRYWDGSLNTVSDLHDLVHEIKVRYGFEDEETPFIEDHVRIAMGLNPRDDMAFTDELDLVKANKEILTPIVAHVSGICAHCDSIQCECSLQGKDAKYESDRYARTKPVIVDDTCIDCGKCVSSCDFGAIADKIEFLPLIDLLKDTKTPVYVTVAPAIAGQFGDEVSLGQLRTAFKLIGFQDMLEVALFADILTIKEAFEFNQLVKTEEDFFLTSCCCPIWFNMIKLKYPDIYEHLSPSVSPMIVSGRILKALYPDAKVVFVAPCIAKKAEAKEEELKDSIDFVINFRELQEVFNALHIHPEQLPADEKDQASFAGRIYARTGGVSFAVKTVVNRLEPSRVIKLKALKVDGVKNCKEVLDSLREGKKLNGNFIEGMGCKGGCVGGPRTIADSEVATRLVNESAEGSSILTPFDNLNVMKILKQFEAEPIESIMNHTPLIKLLSRTNTSESKSQH
jgi:iron only hydrogenase large subunit-like protein